MGQVAASLNLQVKAKSVQKFKNLERPAGVAFEPVQNSDRHPKTLLATTIYIYIIVRCGRFRSRIGFQQRKVWANWKAG